MREKSNKNNNSNEKKNMFIHQNICSLLDTTFTSVSPSPKKGHGKVAKKRALFSTRQHVKRTLSACDGKQRDF